MVGPYGGSECERDPDHGAPHPGPGRCGGAQLAREIESQEEQLEYLKGQFRALPSHVPVGQVQDPATVVQLEQERKRKLEEAGNTLWE